MDVKAPEIEKVVEDYDFIMASGLIIPMTVDKTAGDTIEWDDHKITVTIAAKPSIGNPEEFMPGERTIIILKNLEACQVRERKIKKLTPEQQFELKESLHAMPSTIQ